MTICLVLFLSMFCRCFAILHHVRVRVHRSFREFLFNFLFPSYFILVDCFLRFVVGWVVQSKYLPSYLFVFQQFLYWGFCDYFVDCCICYVTLVNIHVRFAWFSVWFVWSKYVPRMKDWCVEVVIESDFIFAAWIAVFFLSRVIIVVWVFGWGLVGKDCL